MGIPKFYRWLSERYPLLNMPVTATEAPPEIDNIYLDMNGIIHNCTHANDPTLRLTETEMVLRIFMYLDKLIHITKPKKLVFLAIDGVAPRAKMNQQRSRRFKSALERIQREKEAEEAGEATPEEYKFDSNCITPGTEFMARLGKHLHFFLRKKMSEDPVWQTPLVIFSGHDVPGEGEHKIMEYIRWQKRRPDYTPNQRHCMYGLDADLIMLSLVTHEPHFCLLREVVSFTGKSRGHPSRETLSNPSAENFILFQIGLMREYIELEFTSSLADKQLSFTLDIERIIDDVVLFCMLVGNDFLPALPTLDIAEGALNKLIDTYKALLPKLGGYLTHAGELNHGRLQVLLGAIADDELTTMEERAADTEWFESKRLKRGGRGGGRGGGRTGGRSGSSSASNLRPSSSRGSGLGGGSTQPPAAAAVGSFSGGAFTSGTYQVLGELEGGYEEEGLGDGQAPLLSPTALAAAVPLNPVLEGLGELEPEEEEAAKGPTMMSREARNLFLNGGGEEALAAWKAKYYTEKLELPDASPRWTSEVVHHYIRGLHWVLQYYYRGVASWDWFYPYHYAPMAQDMRVLGDIDVSFTRGRPFRPYEQLLAVMPPASATLLPPAFRWLMTDPRSPILDFYPEKFDVDMEGKRAEWEGVVKVPFVSESRLLEAVASIPLDRLTAEERRRNEPGDVLVLEHTAGVHEQEHCDTTLPQHFASVLHAHSICRHVPPPDPLPGNEAGFVPVLAKGTMTGKRSPPGFPTLKTMSNLSVELRLAGVNVFGNPAKKDSLILVLPDVRNSIAADAAAPLLRGMLAGRVYVKWPYLQEAEIVAVSDAKQRMSLEGITQHAPEEAAKWQMLSGQTKNMFLTKTGIDIGALPVLLDVRVCTGYKREVDGSIRKEYAKELAPYPLQAVLQSRPRPPPGFSDPDAAKPLVLQPGTKAVWVGSNYFGCVATVLADPSAKITGRGANQGTYYVRVQPLHPELLLSESRARQVVQQYALHYVLSGQACRQLGLHPRLLGRLTGNIWVSDSSGERVDVGLAVKNAKQGLCVPAMCKPNSDGTGWLYSANLLDLVRQYRAAFPSLFTALDPSSGGGGGWGDQGGGQQGGGDGERQKLRAGDLFPNAPPEQHDTLLQQVASWLKGHVSSKYPLVAASTLQASQDAVDRLQVVLPGLLPLGTAAVGPVELEQVHSSLLLPAHDPAAPQSVLTAGHFEPGDRVVVVNGTGAPAFGSRGTVIGVMPTVVELLLDDEYPGGTTLKGRLRSARGTYLPPEQLLNVSRQSPVRYVGPKPRMAAKQPAPQRGQARAAAAAGSSGDGGPTSPTAVAAAAGCVVRPLLDVAPWLKGKQLQVRQARAAAAAAAAAGGDQYVPPAAAAAAAGGQEGYQGSTGPAAAGQQMPPPAAAGGAAPARSGSRLLQMLKQQGNMPPPPTHLLPQLQQQQPAAAPPAAAATAGSSGGPGVTHEPPPLPGQALLRQLQRGPAAAAAAGGFPTPQQQQQQALPANGAAPPPAQAPPAAAAGGPPPPSSGASLLALLKKKSAAPAANAAAASAAAAAALGGGGQQGTLPGQPPPQQQQQPQKKKKQQSEVSHEQQQQQVQQNGRKAVAQQQQQQQQQPADQGAKDGSEPAVKVVPRPARTKKPEQQQQQQAAAASVAPAAAAAAGTQQQQQQAEAKPSRKAERQPKREQAAPQQQAGAAAAADSSGSDAAGLSNPPAIKTSVDAAAAPAPAAAVGRFTRRARSSDGTVAAAGGPGSDAAAVTPPKVMTPPAAVSRGREALLVGSADGQQQQQAPRTPPAGAGAGLIAQKVDRGEKERIAKLPVSGERGFTMGRGQRVAAALGSNAAAMQAVAAPGSNAAAAGVQGKQTPPLSPQPNARGFTLGRGQPPAGGSNAAAVAAAPGSNAGPAVKQQLASAFERIALTEPLPVPAAAAGGVGGGGVPMGAAPLPPTDSGQLLMRMLQRGGSRNPTSPMQPPPMPSPQQPQQLMMPAGAAVLPPPTAAAAGEVPQAAPAAAAVAAANSSAACNLLRRLQSRGSQGAPS